MMINFEFETKKITTELKKADSYLDCENIILHNIKKHAMNEIAVAEIESYLKKLLIYFEDKMVINKGNEDYVNYKYAAAFLHAIISTPYWHN